MYFLDLQMGWQCSWWDIKIQDLAGPHIHFTITLNTKYSLERQKLTQKNLKMWPSSFLHSSILKNHLTSLLVYWCTNLITMTCKSPKTWEVYLSVIEYSKLVYIIETELGFWLNGIHVNNLNGDNITNKEVWTTNKWPHTNYKVDGIWGRENT